MSDEELMEMVNEYYNRETTKERKKELGIILGYIKQEDPTPTIISGFSSSFSQNFSNE
jgi:hypothetical protein